MVVQFDTKCAVLIPVGLHLSDGANGAPPGLLTGFWGWDEKGRKVGGRKKRGGQERGMGEREQGERKGEKGVMGREKFCAVVIFP